MSKELQNETLPDWMLFIGKWEETIEGHPLVYHLIDSAAVAAGLWQKAMTKGSQEQFSDWLGLSIEDCGRLLAYWTSLHDLGKATPSFQKKHAPTQALLQLRGFDFPFQPQADVRHHSLLSQWILRDFEAELKIQPLRIFNLFRFAIGGHHGTFHVQEDLEQTLACSSNLGGARWKEARRALFTALTSLLTPPILPVLNLSQTDRNALFNLVTGFFVAADWVSSQDESFPYHPIRIPIEEYWAVSQKLAGTALVRSGWSGWQPDGARPDFKDLFGFSPYPLQQMIVEAVEGLQEPFLMIIEAPTGCGKTEAALTAADRAIQTGNLRGCYIAMPTQATSNQMFGRTRDYLAKRYAHQDINLQLIHGNALLNDAFQALRLSAVDDDGDKAEGSINAMEWFLPRKRTLLAPFGVGTVDQTFFSVLRTRHAFLRLFGLHRKVVIFDEVHAYDTYMQEIFCQLLAWLRAVGSPVILLSATLPESTRMQLLRAYQRPSAKSESFLAAYPRLSLNDGHSIQTRPLGKYPDREVHLVRVPRPPEAWIELVREKIADGGCAAVVCNTVDRAQDVFCQLRDAKLVADDELYLLHSHMPFCWRIAKEDAILSKFGKLKGPAKLPRRGIVVATQIIEQSLDLDFDLLVSDLAPVDLMIQRIGRLQRHCSSEFAPQRPARLSEPMCMICQPEDPPPDGLANFEKDVYVYDEVILHRTFFNLKPFDSLTLPADSDRLINAVYSDETLPTCSEAQNSHIQELYQKMLKKKDREISAAQNRLVGDVDQANALGGRMAYLSEDDQSVGKETQALTRNNILPNVQLVCFIRREGQTYLLDELYPLAVEQTPIGTDVNHALRSLVTVSKREVVEYFYTQPRHEAWRKQPALRRAFPAVFENGKYPLGNGIILILNEQIGLKIEEL